MGVVAAFLTFLFLSSPAAHADIVRLKTGKVLEGTVTQDEASVSVDLGKGSIKVPRTRVDWVIHGSKEEIETKAKAGRVFLEGVEALKAFSFKKAVPLFEEAMALEPENAEIKANLAHAYARSGQPGKAAVLYQEALRTNPSSRDLRMNLVSAYVDAGTFIKAAEVLHKMLRDFPRDRELHEKLSLVFHKAGLYTLSVHYAKKAATIPAA